MTATEQATPRPDLDLSGVTRRPLRNPLRIPGWRHVVTLFRRRRRLLFRFVVTALGGAGASMLVILLVREFLAGALGGGGGLMALAAEHIGAEGALWAVAALLLSTYVCGSLMTYDNQVVQQRIVKVLELGMMERLIRHLLTLSVPFFDRQSHGDIIQAVREDVGRMRRVVIAMGNIALHFLVAAGLLVAAVWISPWLTLWGLVVLPLAVFPVFIVARRTMILSHSVRKSGYVLFDIILEILRGIRVIKAFSGEERTANDAVQKGARYFDEIVEMTRARALARMFLESTAGLGTVVVVVLGGLSVMRHQLEWPSLLAFLMALRALHTPLNMINQYYVEIQVHGAAVDRVAQLLESRPEVANRSDALPLTRAPETIAFEGVDFSYEDDVVLHQLTFEVPAGRIVGVVGPSGSGKTTLLNLIVRFYDVSKGRVLFDGVDVRDLRLEDIYAKIAIVTQDPFLFGASVRDNIRCGRPDATETEIEEAARAAYVHEDILNLPDGYDTVVGIGGRSLSGGQRQRINVARALLKNASILLLDEATSSLDSIAEERVQQAIDRLLVGRTSFVVAHRLSTLRNAEQILVLDEGRLAGQGSHGQLLESCELYRQMWKKQQIPVEPLKTP